MLYAYDLRAVALIDFGYPAKAEHPDLELSDQPNLTLAVVSGRRTSTHYVVQGLLSPGRTFHGELSQEGKKLPQTGHDHPDTYRAQDVTLLEPAEFYNNPSRTTLPKVRELIGNGVTGPTDLQMANAALVAKEIKKGKGLLQAVYDADLIFHGSAELTRADVHPCVRGYYQSHRWAQIREGLIRRSVGLRCVNHARFLAASRNRRPVGSAKVSGPSLCLAATPMWTSVCFTESFGTPSTNTRRNAASARPCHPGRGLQSTQHIRRQPQRDRRLGGGFLRPPLAVLGESVRCRLAGRSAKRIDLRASSAVHSGLS